MSERVAKQVIVMRKDLNMRKGKMVAQGAHAAGDQGCRRGARRLVGRREGAEGGSSSGGCPGVTTCLAEGKDCGSIPDGCGNMLPCGTCTRAFESCGGGGTAAPRVPAAGGGAAAVPRPTLPNGLIG